MMAIIPPAMLGVLGGGQLGRMFVVAARTMGYEVMVLDPDPHSPAGGMASEHLHTEYTDPASLDRMVKECAVITTEFENVPVEALQYLSRHRPVHPSPAALAIAKDRILEKNFVQSAGLATSRFVSLENDADLAKLDGMSYPAILKTATLGYDGKGQVSCDNAEQARQAFQQATVRCVLEHRVQLEKEISVVMCRSQHGESHCFPVAENEHVNGILDVSIAPARISPELAEQARQAAIRIADGLDYCGVLAVEFFITTDNELLVNEIAPRPHNSGHYTLDACHTSQFEQQVRMICDLPAANVDLHTPGVMLNLLGDVWPQDGVPDWDALLHIDDAHLHLYGKKHARKGRKMGHVNLMGRDTLQVMDKLAQVKRLLSSAD